MKIDDKTLIKYFRTVILTDKNVKERLFINLLAYPNIDNKEYVKIVRNFPQIASLKIKEYVEHVLQYYNTNS